MLELADRHDLGSCAERREGSIPFFPTEVYIKIRMYKLNIELEQLEDHQVKVVATFEQEVMEQYKRRAARKISEKSKIPGFRPGKAPFDVIRRTYGDDAINEQAIEMIVDEKYSDVLEEAKVIPGAPGRLDEVVSVEPPKFVFIVPKEPEVVLGDYLAVRKSYELQPVTDEDLERIMQNLRESYSTSESVDRPAKLGDMVYCQLLGKIVDPKEDEKEVFIDNISFEIVVGGNNADPDTWPFEGFSKKLVGMAKGEEKTFEHKYPKDNSDDSLKGRKASFTIKVEEVKALQLPEVDDAFAKQLGGFENVDALRIQIRDQAEHQRKHEYDDIYYDELIEKLVSESVVKFPPQILEEETKDVLKSFEDNLGRRKMDLDAYLKINETTKEAFLEDEVKPAAVKRLSRSLVLSEIAKEEKIKVEQDELKNMVTMQMDSLLRSPGFEKVRGQQEIDRLASAVMMDAANHLYNQKTLDRLQAIATGQADSKTESEEKKSANTDKKPVKKKTAPAKSESSKKDTLATDSTAKDAPETKAASSKKKTAQESSVVKKTTSKKNAAASETTGNKSATVNKPAKKKVSDSESEKK